MMEPYVAFNPPVMLQHHLPSGVQEKGEHRDTSSSYKSLLSTLLPLVVISIPLFLTFLFLRVKLRRVYAPRTFIEILDDEEKTPQLENLGLLNWIPEFWRRPDEEVLSHQDLDAYLFLRFLKMVTVICCVGFCLTLPLLVVNHMGRRGKLELRSLTISNIADPNQYYWHCFIAFLFVGYIMYTITGESLYYINLRYAFYMTPRNALRVSSSTVLFTSLQGEWQNEDWLRAEFDQIKRVWFVTDCQKLDRLVKERDNIAYKLEDAEIKLLKTANDKRLRGKVRNATTQGTITSQYVSVNERPKIRSIPLIGQKADAIFSCRSKLQHLIPKIKQQQKSHLDGQTKALPAVFVQYETQRAAHSAFRASYQYHSGSMEARCIGVPPHEVIWNNLAISRPSRIARSIITHVIVILLIIFWSIPVGLVGSLASIETLSDSLPFLSFVHRIPVPILGAITGLLPALLISALLSLVPIVCRFLATKSGAVTLAQVELRTQSWYSAFQIVQVFLVTTFSSGASAIAEEIINDPAKAPSLLAENLSQASNFYLSYFMLQGITVAASELFQIVPLLMFTVADRVFDKTPRSKYNRWTALSGISWGNTYPKLTNLAVIATAYSCVAPLTLAFATVGLGLLYLAFRYNIFYALTTTVNTKGDAYGRALQHLTVGIYLSELCLLGLFAGGKGNGPALLMILLFSLTAVYQLYLNWALRPLLNSLSDHLLASDEEEALAPARMESGESSHAVPSLRNLINDSLGTNRNTGQTVLSEHRERGGIFAPYLFHGSKSSYPALRAKLRSGFPREPLSTIPGDIADTAYLNPSITAPVPTLWIAKDDMGISAEQIDGLRSIIDVEDRGASLDVKGEIIWDQDNLRDSPLWKDKVDL